MSKVDIIEYCGDCSNRCYIKKIIHCELTGDEVTEDGPIPENCQLFEPKNKQVKKMDKIFRKSKGLNVLYQKVRKEMIE